MCSGRTSIPAAAFITCVSDQDIYQRSVVASLEKMDAPKEGYETVPVDNRENRYSAAQALNLGLEKSRAPLLVFCHQDVVFPLEWLSLLLDRIKEVQARFGAFGVLGPAGRCSDGSYAGHVFHPDAPWHHPPLPREVQTVDELCLVIQRESGLRFDEYLDDFHLYGADLCLQAAMKGLPCFAVDCPLTHLKESRRDERWLAQKEKFIRKWWTHRRIVGKKILLTSGSIRLHSPPIRLLRHLTKGLKRGPARGFSC